MLDDSRYTVPQACDGVSGLAWLRASVARFSEGPAHARRRALIDDLLAGSVVLREPGGDPTVALLRGVGLPDGLLPDVELAAAAYQPHAPQSPEADRAADRLVDACGSRDEVTAAKVCVLLQAHAATRALIEKLRAGDGGPPVPTTRRIAPTGVEVEVDLSDAPFGRGRHACPGAQLARLLAEAALR